MTQNSVTIVIPTFNRATMLKRCIESALAQTQACEIIVVDHGSSDNTPAVAASFGNRIRYLRSERDYGVHFCWLDGIIHAQGEYIHLNFDDDYIEPTYIEKCMKLMGTSVGLVFSKVALRDENTGVIEAILFDKFGPTGLYSSAKFMEKQIGGLVSPGATLIRRGDILNALFIGKVPFARAEYRGVGPDWLMTAMTTMNYPKIGFINESLAVFSSHVGSITTSALQDKKKKKALRRAYQESRRFYALLWLAKNLHLDFLADLTLFIMKIKAGIFSRIRYRIRRIFNPQSLK